MNRVTQVILIILIIVISGPPRLAGLGVFTSVDEPFWLRQSANFYYALGQRAFENTIYEYHPAVTTMWVIAAGMLVYFPEYRTLGEGYLKPGKFDSFLPANGKNPLQLLIVSRGIQVAIVIFLLLVVFFLLRRLFDARTAFFSTALISVSPYFLGQSRLLNHEAMLGLFSLISILSLSAYLHLERKFAYLVVSGSAAGMAQLTKSSGLLLLPLVLLMLAIPVGAAWRGQSGAAALALSAAKTLGIWVALLAAAYILFWPGMWVAPAKMLSEVYGNALTYAFQGSRLSVAGRVDPGSLGLDTLKSGLQIYLSDVVWRTTPVTWLGLLLGVGFAVHEARRRTNRNFGLAVLYALVLAAAFILLFSIQRGPKPPHYILSSYIAMDLIAALGLSRALGHAGLRIPQLADARFAWGALGIIILLQLASALSAYPYYITYYNPLLEALEPGIQNPVLDTSGYGVGLERAAAYLALKPGAPDMTVMSANGYGCFSYYFPGHTIPINTFTLSDPQVAQILHSSQYAVVDYYNQQRSGLASDLQGIEPEHVIWIDGIEFLHIYRSADFLARLRAAPP